MRRAATKLMDCRISARTWKFQGIVKGGDNPLKLDSELPVIGRTRRYRSVKHANIRLREVNTLLAPLPRAENRTCNNLVTITSNLLTVEAVAG